MSIRYSTVKSVVLQVLAHGASTIADIEPRPSPRTIKKVIAELRKIKRGDLADRLKHLQMSYGHHNRGRPLPMVGETRRYAVHKAGTLDFIRVPAQPLGAMRVLESHLDVTFYEDRIVIRRVQGEEDARTFQVRKRLGMLNPEESDPTGNQ